MTPCGRVAWAPVEPARGTSADGQVFCVAWVL